ncbi:hypothetical protein ACFQFH_15415 [Halobaculum halobium]|uniref:Uncharacterized protein n=1 Tax=Halobaculum halobium TaxID=3032281 RepID=A0ABD5TF29_9EURY|nr:hypothetical protein [Halobaculum sp. SYNS20]
MDARSRARLALALLLVTAPLWGPPLDLTGPDYEYRTVDITVDGGEIAVTERGYWRGPTDRIACFSRSSLLDHDRGCYLESRLQNGTVSVDYPGLGGYNGAPQVAGADYVVFGIAGPVYERTIDYDEANGSFVFGLDRVDPETALDDVSRDADRAPPAIRRALDGESVRRNEPVRFFGSERIYRHDGGYVIVSEDEIHDGYSEQPGVERALEALSVLFGALTLYQVGRDSVRGS